MKKVLVWVLCLLMIAMPVVASAQGRDAKIDNVIIESNGTEIDLSGIGLLLGYGSIDEGIGVHAAVLANDEVIAQGAIECIENMIIGYADGITDTYSYSLNNIWNALGSALAGLIENFDVSALESIDMESVSDTFGALLEKGEEVAGTWATVLTQVLAMVAGGIGYEGETEVDGVTYEKYTFDASTEVFTEVIDGICAAIDSTLAAFGGEEYANIEESFAQSAITLSVNGYFLMGETSCEACTDLNIEQDGVTIPVIEVTYAGEKTYENDKTYNHATASLLVESGEGLAEVAAAQIDTTTLEDGTLAAIVCSFNAGYLDVTYSMTMPALQDDGLTAISVVSEAFASSFDLTYGESIFTLGMALGENAFNVIVEKVSDETVTCRYDQNLNGTETGFQFNFSILDTEADWLRTEAGETVDILTLDEEQLETLKSEALGVLVSAGMQLVGTNLAAAGLFGDMLA